jgi:hypothetical protein
LCPYCSIAYLIADGLTPETVLRRVNWRLAPFADDWRQVSTLVRNISAFRFLLLRPEFHKVSNLLESLQTTEGKVMMRVAL